MTSIEDATHIDVEAEVRYWEDARVDGRTDDNGTLIPGREGDVWRIRIDLATGRIEDWPKGTRADVHYKVCDQGEYWLSDAAGTRLAKWYDHYVPGAFLCHGDNGFGDYIIFKVDGDGTISDYVRPVVDMSQWVAIG